MSTASEPACHPPEIRAFPMGYCPGDDPQLIAGAIVAMFNCFQGGFN